MSNPLPNITHEDLQQISKEVGITYCPVLVLFGEEITNQQEETIEKYLTERGWINREDYLTFYLYESVKHYNFPKQFLCIIDFSKDYYEFPGMEEIDI